MSISQKHYGSGDNVAGDKYVIGGISRVLTKSLKDSVIANLSSLQVSSVSIQFEYDSETKSFVREVASFLKSQGYKVYGDNDVRIGSGISKNEFMIKKHPTDATFAVIRIGTQ